MAPLKVFLLSLLAWAVILGGLWLLPAGLLGGTWVWTRGLWAAGVVSLIQASAASVFAARIRASGDAPGPASPDEKHRGWREPLVDAIGIAYGLAFFVFIPIDVFHLRLLALPPPAVSAAGGLVSVAGVVVMQAAILQHAPRDRETPRVLDSGLYAIVRHPMYLGALLWLGGAAVWLESLAALVAASGIFVFILIRIAIEEAHLRGALPGYIDYASRVRSRVLPFVV